MNAKEKVLFTDSARRALILAQKEAEGLEHPYIGTEHLILGLLHVELGMASSVLRSLGLDLAGVRQEVGKRYRHPGRAPSSGKLTLSPGGRRAIRRAILQARQRNESLLGTEHILLSLLDYSEGTASRMLADLGIEPENVRDELQRLMQSESPVQQPEIPGAQLIFKERYQIEDVIGAGSLSTVYRARDLNFPDIVRLVAIKEMVPPADDEVMRQSIVQNFAREAEILASLKHPFIPRFYDFFTYERRFYLVMEYIEGKTLSTILENTPGFLAIDRVLRWSIQLCDVLAYLHNHQPQAIIFRDLKPANVMIDSQDNIRLIDFNIAKVFEHGEVGARFGTEGYSAPEQYHGDTGPRGDLYSLGATMHHLLTRQDPRYEAPFSFDTRPIKARNPAVTSELDQAIHRALAYEPEDRYTTAMEMKGALEAVLSQMNAGPATGDSTYPSTRS